MAKTGELAKLVKKERRVPQKEEADWDVEQFPLDYIMGASKGSLEAFELKQLSIAANLQTEMMQLNHQRDRARLLADLARFAILHRDELLKRAGRHLKLAEGAEVPPRLKE